MTSIMATRSGTANGRTLLLLTMCLGVLVVQIDTSVVNLALKHIDADFRVGVSGL